VREAGRPILGAYNLACLVSLAGLAAAVAAMVLASWGVFELAVVGLILAGVADLFDGVVARRLELGDFAKEFGVQLDTTVDVVAFLATPAVIALSILPAAWPGAIGIGSFVIAGVVRLAHFNTLSVRGADQSTHHRGLPVTYSALIFPLVFLLRDALPAERFQQLLIGVFVVLACLFVVNVPVPKPRGVLYIVLPLLAVGLTVYWIGRYLNLIGAF
jgi:CDP-diacylglycerol--serine O-phosphatidyltransferase